MDQNASDLSQKSRIVFLTSKYTEKNNYNTLYVIILNFTFQFSNQKVTKTCVFQLEFIVYVEFLNQISVT